MPDPPPSSSGQGHPAEAEGWRVRILAALRAAGRPPVARAPRLQSCLSYLGIVVISVLTVFVAPAAMMELLRNADLPVVIIVGVVWLFLAVFVLARVRNSLFRRSLQLKARSAEEALQKAGGKRPILYLRSFQLDRSLEKPSLLERLLGTVPMANAEQQLTRWLNRLGPVIAIGRPDENLPALGAARFYVSHECWQEKVAEVASESQLVVWASGVTEGLQWEIQHLVEKLPPSKLILWAHPHLLRVGRAAREAEWTKFRQTLGTHFPQPLPEVLGKTRIFRFADDWKPVAFAPEARPGDWLLLRFPSRQDSALRALLEDREPPEVVAKRRRRRRTIGRVMRWTAGVLVVAAGVITAVLMWNDHQHSKLAFEEDAVDSMAGAMMAHENWNREPGSANAILELHRRSATGTFARTEQRIEEVRGLARDYVAIFEEAHKTLGLETLLYGGSPPRIAGVHDAREAQSRIDEIRRVRGLIATFLKHLTEVQNRSSWKYSGTTYWIDKLRERTQLRDGMLGGEEDMLQMLVQHADEWHAVHHEKWSEAQRSTGSVSVPASTGTDTIPLFGDGSLRKEFRGRVIKRYAAMEALQKEMQE